jgi:DNA-binding beta-propeller fold protein YncE
MVEGWAQLPAGRPMGAVGGVRADPDGKHLWAVIRCEAAAPDRFGNECLDSDLDPVVKFELATGRAVAGFGGGMFIWPHGIDVDPQGNVWVTDAVLAARVPQGDRRGHQVVKFSPSGEVLMRLGQPGVPGAGEGRFNSPSDVVIGDDGAIFVADGHPEDGNNRIVKFSAQGKFLKAWGRTGYAPGEFRTLHALAIDRRGRLFVADRGNNRVQIFDQEGTHLATWTQFGRPSGIYFGPGDTIYVADSESDDIQNPGWEMGLRIGDAQTGWIHYFVRFPWGDPRQTRGSGAEFVAVDNDGNLYAGEPFRRVLQKYVRVMP